MRLIDADELLEKHTTEVMLPTAPLDMLFDAVVVNYIKGAPTVEAEPVRHGRWIHEGHDDWNNYYRCSCCGKLFGDNSRKHDPYCSNCGAKMNGAEA